MLMTKEQITIIITYGFLAFFIFLKGVKESIRKKQSFKLTPSLFPLGIFVWGDAIVIGPFWVIISLIAYFSNDWLLFLLTISVFWLVRSLGETIYWLNQQFSLVNRNPPEKLIGYQLIKSNSIWFIYQIFWQCVTVISTITTIYLSAQWLKKI